LLDLQSLPSLERFDSRFLDIFRDSGNEAGAGGVPVMDELQAPDDDLALQRLMSLRNGQHKVGLMRQSAGQAVGGVRMLCCCWPGQADVELCDLLKLCLY
jgi:hypothetical protein